MIPVKKAPTKLDEFYKMSFAQTALGFMSLLRSSSVWTSVKCCRVPLGGVTIKQQRQAKGRSCAEHSRRHMPDFQGDYKKKGMCVCVLGLNLDA